jgi:hypothetical protein
MDLGRNSSFFVSKLGKKMKNVALLHKLGNWDNGDY